MAEGSISTNWAGEELMLFPERGVYWHRTRTLLIADPHFGKTAAFRKVGIPIPSGTTTDDLGRLDSMLDSCTPDRLLILGDFFHSKAGRCEMTLQFLADWRTRRSSMEILLIRGNHDRHAGDPPPEWNIRVEAKPHAEAPFYFCHEPCDHETLHIIGGHIHPGINLWDRTGGSIRLPCFWFGERSALVPAFGSFTGTYTVKPRRGDQLFVIGDGEVVRVRTGPMAKVPH
ncbi:MAG: ligase-associated DNA damage response endonuclease PdeM [Candidatus Sumerlaeaceae bacterium]